MRFGAVVLLIVSAALLQGCAAALLPVVAAGAIGKTQVDAAQARTRAAEQQLADLPQAQREAVVTVAPVEETPTPAAEPVVQAAQIPAQPSAIIIDMDEAPGVELSDGEAIGFGELLQYLRDNGIVIAWVSDRSTGELAEDLALLQGGDFPAMQADDIQLFAWLGLRKQERRWNFAATHCVLAIAGDRKSDFDELFDYLRDPDYAIRLDAWTDRGWFLLPYPAAVAAATHSPKATEVDNTP